MDFGDLDDILQEPTYLPAFNKTSRTANTRPLLRNNSNKSIENTIVTPPPPPPLERSKPNLLQMHKDTRKEVLTFEEMMKKQNEQVQYKPQRKAQVKQVKFDLKQQAKQVKKNTKGNDNFWNDQDDDMPMVGQNRMKPPIAKRGDDGKSVVSRRNDDNKSTASVADFKKPRQQVESFNNFSTPQPQANLSIASPSINQSLDKTVQIRRDSAQVKQINNYVVDTSELKKMLQDQLQIQRQLNEKLLKQQQQAHKRQIEKIKSLHSEQLSKKMMLKDMEIQKLKQYFEMQLQMRKERTNEIEQMSNVNRKFEQGVRALEKAEEQLRSKGTKLDEDLIAKTNQNKVYQQFAREKENYVKQLLQRLQVKQKDFREQKQRFLSQIQRQKRRLQEQQSNIYKKQRQLQQKILKRERTLVDEYQQKQKKLSNKQSQLRLQRAELEQQRLKLQREKQQVQIRNRKWEESRIKTMEQIQAQKIKLISKEVQLNSKNSEWYAKEGQIMLKQKELTGKLKLIDLERKKFQVQKDMKKRKVGYESKINFGNVREQLGPSPIQKSIKQLKDQYLRNLGHI